MSSNSSRTERDFKSEYVKVSTHVQEEIERLKKHGKYIMLKTFLYDKVFKDEKELKIGYLNINGLERANHIQDFDNDKNLLHLDCIILSETWLVPKVNISDICKKLDNWAIHKDGRLDFDNKEHMGLLVLKSKISSQNFKIAKSDQFQRTESKFCFQYVSVKFNHCGIVGNFVYLNRTPSNEDLGQIIKHLPDSDFIMGDFNLNPMKEDQMKSLEVFSRKIDMDMFLQENTMFNTQLDHCFISEDLRKLSYSTSYANLYSDHFTITLRISDKNMKSDPTDKYIFFDQNFLNQRKLNMDDDFKMLQNLITEDKENNISDDEENIELKTYRSKNMNSSKNNAKNDIVINFKGFTLTRHDLNTIQNKEWINVNIINVFFVMLRFQFSNIYTFTTLFYDTLKEKGYEAVKKFTNTMDKNIFKKELILIPIHTPNYWTLGIVDLCKLPENVIKITIYDPHALSRTRKSLKKNNENRSKRIEKYIKNEYSRINTNNFMGDFIFEFKIGHLVEDKDIHESGTMILETTKTFAFRNPFKYAKRNMKSMRKCIEDDLYKELISDPYKKQCISPKRYDKKIKLMEDTSHTHKKNSKPNEKRRSSPKTYESQEISSRKPKQRVEKQFIYESSITGLNNLGNTCYLNSLLQCLYNLEWFSKCIDDLEKFGVIKNQNSISSILKEFFRKKKENENKNDIDLTIQNMLKNIGTVATERHYYPPGAQQDPSEFFLHLLRCIHTDIIGTHTLTWELKNVETLENYKSSYFQNHLKPLTSHLTTFSRTRTVYNEHAHYKIKGQICKKPTMIEYSGCPTFFLELSSQEIDQNIQEMLKSKIEKKNNIDDVKCSDCGLNNFTGTRQEKILEYPKCLVIVLQRFTAGKKNFAPITTGCLDDKTKEITISIENIDLSYTLNGVILHYGQNTMSGHYVACIYEKNNWFILNDDEVSNYEATDVKLNSNNYMLFYRKKQLG